MGPEEVSQAEPLEGKRERELRDLEWAKLGTSCDTEHPPFKLLWLITITTTIIKIERIFSRQLVHAHFKKLIHLIFTAVL